jgi:hypothetical protein
VSAIESIKATIESIDVKMGKEPEYLTVRKIPLERVHILLSRSLYLLNTCTDFSNIVTESLNQILLFVWSDIIQIFKINGPV